MPKRTRQPNKSKRAKSHGYRSRSGSPSGQKTLKRRRQKGRTKLSA